MTDTQIFLNKAKLLQEIVNSYSTIYEITPNKDEIKAGLNCLLHEIFDDLTPLCNSSFITYKYKFSDLILGDFPEWFLNRFVKNKNFCFPIEINTKQPFSILIKTDGASRQTAEFFLQNIILNIACINQKGDVLFKCVDKKKSGLSYGKLIRLISENQIFGKKIYKSDSDVSDLINDLEKIASSNVIKLKGLASSVYDYNKINKPIIPISIAVFCDAEDLSSFQVREKLSEIINNSFSTGISTIFLYETTCPETYSIVNENTFVFEFENNQAFVAVNGAKFKIDIDSNNFSTEKIEALEKNLNQLESLDTRFSSFYDINDFHYFSMDSTAKLSIPFAFTENKEIVNLEIGGEAPPHALLSGSTGSGKSVLLHTIIEQTMLYYHPDDVEIWAIDYKAVEFGCYVLNKTPHITVIGQDNSEDFSLSLIDLIQKEYNRRKNLFIQNNTRDLEAYRKRFGKYSMSRLLIVIDEFHNLTQAIQNYSGNKNYKTILENLLREMRAMGMSFLFCSQTIAAGLNGLTEAARNQIGCRLSMKHEDVAEIRETLSLSLSSNSILEEVKNLRKGQVVYKKQLIEQTESAFSYELKKLNVLFISDEERQQIINNINQEIGNDYIKREEIICKNNDRYYVHEKKRHPISKFVEDASRFESDLLTLFPGAPTTLEDSLAVKMDEEAGNNLLIIGENDDLRESIVFHSVLGLLIDPATKVVVSILDTENADNARLYSELSAIKSTRLVINYGFSQVVTCLKTLKKIRPSNPFKVVYVWYGLNKLKNFIFLNNQENNEDKITKTEAKEFKPLEAMQQALAQIEKTSSSKSTDTIGETLTFDDCKAILKQLAEYGPENNRYNISIFNTLKSMKKSGLIKLEDYEYRIGLPMSTDDSYDLFGSSGFIAKADYKTVVYYNGSKTPTTVRPYLMPDSSFLDKFNIRLEHENE